MASSPSDCACFPKRYSASDGNPDITGIGVILSIFFQNFCLVLLTIMTRGEKHPTRSQIQRMDNIAGTLILTSASMIISVWSRVEAVEVKLFFYIISIGCATISSCAYYAFETAYCDLDTIFICICGLLALCAAFIGSTIFSRDSGPGSTVVGVGIMLPLAVPLALLAISRLIRSTSLSIQNHIYRVRREQYFKSLCLDGYSSVVRRRNQPWGLWVSPIALLAVEVAAVALFWDYDKLPAEETEWSFGQIMALLASLPAALAIIETASLLIVGAYARYIPLSGIWWRPSFFVLSRRLRRKRGEPIIPFARTSESGSSSFRGYILLA